MNPAPFNDADGNMTTGPVPGANGLTLGVPAPSSATLEWDAENRLVKAVVNNITVNYAYDHLSRLISRGEGVTPATWTHYRYDGWNRIAEYSDTALSKVYTWGLDLSGSPQGAGGVGGLLCVLDKPTGSRYYPTYDGNGNVSEYYEYTLDSNPNTVGNQTVSEVAAHFEYDPFGNLTAGTAAIAEAFPFRFSTKPQDPVTGLYYYGYRWYAPLTGRWPSRDLIEESGGVNLYDFVGNEGVDNIDRLGLIPEWGFAGEAGRVYFAPVPTPEQERERVRANCIATRKAEHVALENAKSRSLGRTPDCSKSIRSGCGLVTLVIELKDPCIPLSSSWGHAGIAVGNNFYDFGPREGGNHWALGENQKLDKLRDGIRRKDMLVGRDIVAIEFCACNASGIEKAMLDLRNNPRPYTPSNLHCTSAICRAVEGISMDVPFVGTAVTPNSLFWQSAYTSFNTCGADFLRSPNVKILSLADVNR